MRGRKLKFELLLVVLAVLMLAGAVASAVTTARPSMSVTAQRGPAGASMEVTIPDLGPVRVRTLPSDEVVVNVGELPQGGNPGDPLLPYALVRLLVPPDADLETVKVELVAGAWEELPGEYEIVPAPPAATGEEEKPILSWGTKDESLIINGRDSTIYGTNAYFPSEPAQIVSVGEFRQWKLVEFRVWVAVYNPVKKKVRVLINAQIAVSVQALPATQAIGLSSSTPPVLPGAARFAPGLLAGVANPQDFEAFYGTLEGAPSPAVSDYVIITTSTIVSSSTKLASFIADKQAQGFTVKTVVEGAAQSPTTYVSGATCDARANNIRSWLQSYWSGDGIEYVLLIGNPHPSTFSATTSVPMKMCWPRSTQPTYQSAPSDMFFAELSNTWDLDADGKYGEFVGDYGAGGADKFCEVKLGRIPFYGDYTDLDAILQKSIDYGNASGDLSWRAKVLIPAAISNFGPQDNNGDGDAIDTGDYPNSTWRTFGDDWGEDVKSLGLSNGFSTYTLYEKTGVYSDGSAYPLTSCDAALNNANFISEWQNYYGFVTWWAHGGQTSAARFCWTSDSTFVGIMGNKSPHYEASWPTLVSTADCASLDDNYPSFVVQVSCLNGYPENSNNLGYRLLKRGAIGTISGTRVTWYAIGSWNTGLGASYGDNASYGYYCFDRMSGFNETVGEAQVWCRANFGTNWASGSSWMNMVDLSLYGDPSLSLVVTKMVKWLQPPDETENGIDIRCDRSDGIQRTLADDFECTTTGPITKVIFWGSWFNDYKGKIKEIHLSIHNNKPATAYHYSEPNELLWEKDFTDFNETLYHAGYEPEWWWDPATGMPPIPWADRMIWQYEIDICPEQVFIQQGDPCDPNIYWLDIYVELEFDPCDPRFGWKTSEEHWEDDAVYDDGTFIWNELRYPPEHPYYPESIDLAFAIITGEPCEPSDIKWSQPPVPYPDLPDTYIGWDEESHDWLPRMVLDDFLCDTNRPVTAIRWWGSFLGWTGPDPPPELPYAFLITIWDNVPAGVDADYSHPNEVIWGTICDVYDVNFYGWEYDPNIGEIDLAKFEFYQELEPDDYWYQPNETDVYWLGIAAIYGDMPHDPCYPWGWETRPHYFEDDAVRFLGWPEPNKVYPPTMFEPIELFDETWDLSFELISSPKLPSKPLIEHSKWSQPPIEIDPTSDVPTYSGWDEQSLREHVEPEFWHLVADDFRCLGTMPITSIHWWGSHIEWGEAGVTPPDLPIGWRIGFWSNVPAPADPNADPNYSYPEELLWQIEVDADRVDFEEVGSDYYHGYYPNDICYQYTLHLEPEEWFRQADFNEMTQDDIFWLSIAAVYDPCMPYPKYRWGWKTRPWHWMDDAVRFWWDGPLHEGMLTDPTLVEPIKDLLYKESFDLAFELDTEPNYIKWEQHYTGIRHWPHYWDELSMAAMETVTGSAPVALTPESLTKSLVNANVRAGASSAAEALATQSQIAAEQGEAAAELSQEDIHITVSTTEAGITVVGVGKAATAEPVPAGSVSSLQYCKLGTGTDSNGYITGERYVFGPGLNIYFGAHYVNLHYGRWTGDGWYRPNGTQYYENKYHLYIPDPPVGQYWVWYNVYYYYAPMPASMASVEGNWTAKWWDAGVNSCTKTYTVMYNLADHKMCADVQGSSPYDPIDVRNTFSTTEDKCYSWLRLDNYALNWTNDVKWRWFKPDGSLYAEVQADITNPGAGSWWGWVKTWCYISIAGFPPASNPGNWHVDVYVKDYQGIYEKKFTEYFTIQPATTELVIKRLVADDWKCERRTPVTAAVWWGSYLDYQYKPCSGRFMDLPVKPDYFQLTIWDDVPVDPCDPDSWFSHPNDIMWQYNAYDYDEVLVGYDKFPHGQPQEPVFRYSVRLPEEDWFCQTDINEVFWLSVMAVYDENEPSYDWGWTNHKHVFNDNAVEGGYIWGEPYWAWQPLYDQTGASEDMSFMLFTDPNECCSCANYNHDWIINFLDYAYFANNWCWIGPAGGYNKSDLNCDGVVDFKDLKIFVLQWLSYCP